MAWFGTVATASADNLAAHKIGGFRSGAHNQGATSARLINDN